VSKFESNHYMFERQSAADVLRSEEAKLVTKVTASVGQDEQPAPVFKCHSCICLKKLKMESGPSCKRHLREEWMGAEPAK